MPVCLFISPDLDATPGMFHGMFVCLFVCLFVFFVFLFISPVEKNFESFGVYAREN